MVKRPIALAVLYEENSVVAGYEPKLTHNTQEQQDNDTLKGYVPPKLIATTECVTTEPSQL